MKRNFVALLISILLFPCMRAADGDLFPYPKVPDDITNLSERCDFIVSRFWAPCNFKAALSTKDKFSATFNDWVDLMQYASADTVHSAITRLLKRVEKDGPVTLELARMAERCLYTDSSEYVSEEIYYPFAQAAAQNKKIKAADKIRYQHHAKILENSMLKGKVKHLDYVLPDGTPGDFSKVNTQMIVLLFNDHDCDDCALARIRLSADINATVLINAGLLTVMSIEPGEASSEWKEAAASYPDNWIVGASEDADEYFSLPLSPTIFLLDARHKVLAKNIRIDGLLAALKQLRANAGV